MTDAFQITLLVAFCSLFVVICGAIISFFAVRWVKSLDHSIMSLTAAVNRLEAKMEVYEKDRERREDTRGCALPECPVGERRFVHVHKEEPHG